MPWPTSRIICNLYFIVHFIFHIANCLLCILYRVFFIVTYGLLLIFYMYICRVLLIQLLGCHIEINACLVLWYQQLCGAEQYGSGETTSRPASPSPTDRWQGYGRTSVTSCDSASGSSGIGSGGSMAGMNLPQLMVWTLQSVQWCAKVNWEKLLANSLTDFLFARKVRLS